MEYLYLKLDNCQIPNLEHFQHEDCEITHINDILLSDIYWEPFHLLGGTIQHDDKHLWIENPNNNLGIFFKDYALLRTLEDLTLNHEKAHMRLFKELGLFHDGGDDFDDAGTTMGSLADILIHNLDKFTNQPE